MSAGHSAFQVRAHCGAALIDRGLLRLILRGVLQRAFVILTTPNRTRRCSRRRADIAEIGRPRASAAWSGGQPWRSWRTIWGYF